MIRRVLCFELKCGGVLLVPESEVMFVGRLQQMIPEDAVDYAKNVREHANAIDRAAAELAARVDQRKDGAG